MRKVPEIRDRCAQTLEGMLLRPSMYGWGNGYEMNVRVQLQDLAFIDDREPELEAAFREQRQDGLYGELGAFGPLSAELAPADCTDALAATYARVAARMGYFTPTRRLSPAELGQPAEVLEWARAEPRTRADVEARFGPPSYRAASQYAGVLAYASASDETPWLSFYVEPSRVGALTFVRLPLGPFERALVDLRPSDPEASKPEDAYRDFLVASLYGNEQEIRKHLCPREPASVLWKKAYPRDVARLLARQYRSMSILRVPPPEDVVYLVSEGCPLPLAAHRHGAGWRIDPTPLVRSRQAARSSEKPPARRRRRSSRA